jgi:hypothetical protein
MALIVLSVVALGLGGCSSINQREGYSGNDGQSFLMVAADGMPPTGSRGYSFVFQKVDLRSSAFFGERVLIDFGPWGPVAGNEFEKPGQLITTIRFGGEVVSPGDYALISRSDNVTLGPEIRTEQNCFNRSAPVFHVAERQITLVPAGNAMTSEPLDAETAEREATQVIANYPKYSAPLAPAKVRGRLFFEVGTDILGRPTCDPRGQFRFSDAPSTSVGGAT